MATSSIIEPIIIENAELFVDEYEKIHGSPCQRTI